MGKSTTSVMLMMLILLVMILLLWVHQHGTQAKKSSALEPLGMTGSMIPFLILILKERRLPFSDVETRSLTPITTVMPQESFSTSSPPPEPLSTERLPLRDTIIRSLRPKLMENSLV